MTVLSGQFMSLSAYGARIEKSEAHFLTIHYKFWENHKYGI